MTAHHAPQVASFLQRELPPSIIRTIIDGTAHIGCDTLNFALAYPKAHITAVDIDSLSFGCLDLNIKTFFRYEFQREQFTLVKDDFLNVVKTFGEDESRASIPHAVVSPQRRVDLVYLDPPWGGPDYYKKQRLMLYLSDIPVYSIVDDIFSRNVSDKVLLKVPKNFDVIEFAGHLSGKNRAYSYHIKFFSVLKVNNRVAFTLLLIIKE